MPRLSDPSNKNNNYNSQNFSNKNNFRFISEFMNSNSNYNKFFTIVWTNNSWYYNRPFVYSITIKDINFNK